MKFTWVLRRYGMALKTAVGIPSRGSAEEKWARACYKTIGTQDMHLQGEITKSINFRDCYCPEICLSGYIWTHLSSGACWRSMQPHKRIPPSELTQVPCPPLQYLWVKLFVLWITVDRVNYSTLTKRQKAARTILLIQEPVLVNDTLSFHISSSDMNVIFNRVII